MTGEDLPRTMNFDITYFCPALIALNEKRITDEKGYLLPPDQIKEMGFEVKVEYNPIHPDTAFTECVAPIEKGNANKPGFPGVEIIETDAKYLRLRVRCRGCTIQRGGFSAKTSCRR